MASHVRVLILSNPSIQPAKPAGPTMDNQAWGSGSAGPCLAEPCCRARTEFSLPNLASQLLRCNIGREMGGQVDSCTGRRCRGTWLGSALADRRCYEYTSTWHTKLNLGG